MVYSDDVDIIAVDIGYSFRLNDEHIDHSLEVHPGLLVRRGLLLCPESEK